MTTERAGCHFSTATRQPLNNCAEVRSNGVINARISSRNLPLLVSGCIWSNAGEMESAVYTKPHRWNRSVVVGGGKLKVGLDF